MDNQDSAEARFLELQNRASERGYELRYHSVPTKYEGKQIYVWIVRHSSMSRISEAPTLLEAVTNVESIVDKEMDNGDKFAFDDLKIIARLLGYNAEYKDLGEGQTPRYTISLIGEPPIENAGKGKNLLEAIRNAESTIKKLREKRRESNKLVV